MSRNDPKDLYRCKKFEELEQHFNVSPKYGNYTVQKILDSILKLNREAEKYKLECDEELEYIFRMKYLNLLQMIQRSPNYATEKAYVKQILGANIGVLSVLNRTEILADSLRKRYKRLEDDSLAKVTAKIQFDRAESKKNLHATSVGFTEQSEDKKESVTPKELYNMLQDPQHSYLIMDCRPETDYLNSRINTPHIVNIPENIIVPGKSAGKLLTSLSPQSKALFSARNIKQCIILMDENTKGPTLMAKTQIYTLDNILKNWDEDRNNKLLMVEGGYEKFRLLYPHQCLNPQYKPENSYNSDTYSLDDLEYPDIRDIQMKDDSFSIKRKYPEVPQIDRSSKAGALKTYEKKNKIEILEEKKNLLDKTIQNEKEMIESEQQLKVLAIESDKALLEEERNRLSERVKELEYILMQHESKKKDIEQDQSHIEDLLKDEDSRKISTQEAAQLEAEAIKRQKEIKEKEEEARILNERRARVALENKERQKQLDLAREQKPKVKENVAKVPQIDRTVKPNFSIQPLYDYNYNRDFSPVRGHVGRGLTGLKNLGNTCYMNSILQVLSNTGHFNEILIEGGFQKYVNMKNETQGRVVHEVAALIKALWTGQYKYIASKNLKYVVGQYERKFNGIEQQDSHEFLTYLIDWLHSDLHTDRKAYDQSVAIPASEKAWFQFTNGIESIMTQYFYGQTKSTVKCTKCGKESATYESFSHLSLELPADSNRCSLTDCLNMYFHGEHIRGWNCPGCKSNQDAIKKLDISKLPPILIIHFKRFCGDSDFSSPVYRKKQNYVQFPLNNFRMNEYVARTEMNQNNATMKNGYHLYGVSNHYGTLERGHYTAYCKNAVLSKWYKFDDQQVSSLDSSDIVSSAAYILFYSSLEDQPPSDVR